MVCGPSARKRTSERAPRAQKAGKEMQAKKAVAVTYRKIPTSRNGRGIESREFVGRLLRKV